MAEIKKTLHLLCAVRKRLMAMTGFRIPIAMADMRLQIDHWRFDVGADEIFIIFVWIELRQEFWIPVFNMHVNEITAEACAIPIWICHS